VRGVGHRLTIPEGDRDRASDQALVAFLSRAAVDEEREQGIRVRAGTAVTPRVILEPAALAMGPPVRPEARAEQAG